MIVLAAVAMLATLLLATQASALTYYGVDDGYGPWNVTSLGDSFDPWGSTAAHPDPALLGTYQTVCAVTCETVYVNDTCACPDFDVSKGVAVRIGLI